MIYINYPGICEPFTASIQTNIVAARLGGKPENLHKSNAGAILGSTLMALRTWLMDKDEDLPTPGTNFPVRGYYLAGSQTYCLWSILRVCRSSSKLHRLDFWYLSSLTSGIWIKRRVLDHGVGCASGTRCWGDCSSRYTSAAHFILISLTRMSEIISRPSFQNSVCFQVLTATADRAEVALDSANRHFLLLPYIWRLLGKWYELANRWYSSLPSVCKN